MAGRTPAGAGHGRRRAAPVPLSRALAPAARVQEVRTHGGVRGGTAGSSPPGVRGARASGPAARARAGMRRAPARPRLRPLRGQRVRRERLVRSGDAAPRTRSRAGARADPAEVPREGRGAAAPQPGGPGGRPRPPVAEAARRRRGGTARVPWSRRRLGRRAFGRHQCVHQAGDGRRLHRQGLPHVARDGARRRGAGRLGPGHEAGERAPSRRRARRRRGIRLSRQHAGGLPPLLRRPPGDRPAPGGRTIVAALDRVGGCAAQDDTEAWEEIEAAVLGLLDGAVPRLDRRFAWLVAA